MIFFRRFENYGEEFDHLTEMYHNPYFSDFFRKCPKDLNLEQLKSLENIIQGNLHTARDETRKFLGFTALVCFDPYAKSAHIGIMLKDGNCREVLTSYVNWLFQNTDLNKVSFKFLQSKSHWGKALSDSGCHSEAVYEESIFFEGKWHTEIEYAITRKQFYDHEKGK